MKRNEFTHLIFISFIFLGFIHAFLLINLDTPSEKILSFTGSIIGALLTLFGVLLTIKHYEKNHNKIKNNLFTAECLSFL